MGTPFDQTQGRLSVVATPIGNLGDITLRALETLKKADVIACEDTRVSSKLLARYEIKKPLTIFHARSNKGATDKVLGLLRDGKHIALVTDAGTPGVSDPGVELVARARALGARIEAIPGASALTAALSIAGVDTSTFRFLGFLPHKKGRLTLFKEIAREEGTVVFYESPHRILKALESLAEVLSEGREVVLCRELTKIHEEVLRGEPRALAKELTTRGAARGEFVVIVAPC